LALWEARCLVRLGRLVEAEERYGVVERYELRPEDPTLFRSAVDEATSEVDRLRERIPKVKIVIRGMASNDPSLDVRIDELRVQPAVLGYPAPVDPGTHTIRALVRGKEQSSVTLVLKERDKKQVILEVGDAAGAEPAPDEAEKPAPAPSQVSPAAKRAEPKAPEQPAGREPSSPRGAQYTVGSVAVGVGTLGLVAGVVSGAISVSKNATLREACPDGNCPPEYHDDLQLFRTTRDISTVGYIVAAVGLPLGAILMLTAPAESSPTGSGSTGVWLGAASGGIFGTF
jgi:hypothetical protein